MSPQGSGAGEEAVPQHRQPLLVCEPQPGAAKLWELTHGEGELAQLVAGLGGEDLG